MSKFGERLIAAAKEARAIARGEADPSTYTVHKIEPVDVKEVRESMNMTQPKFAEVFAIPVGTLRDWEQKRRQPEGPARILLHVIKSEPDAVRRALSKAANPFGNAAKKAPLKGTRTLVQPAKTRMTEVVQQRAASGRPAAKNTVTRAVGPGLGRKGAHASAGAKAGGKSRG